MTSWPKVINEHETLDKVLEGYSIARYGDGELNLCRGFNCISQIKDEKLAKELKEILRNPHPKCIVGIPNKREDCPKNWFWNKIVSNQTYIKMMSPSQTYYSQFITRPDSAPWINNKEFWDRIELLWKDKDVILVAGSHRSLTKEKLTSAKSVTVVEALYRDTFQICDKLEQEVLALPHKTVLLCCGATATILANRLAPTKHALDLGHLGMYWKWRAECLKSE